MLRVTITAPASISITTITSYRVPGTVMGISSPGSALAGFEVEAA